MGNRLDDAEEAWRRSLADGPKNAWGTYARGDQTFYVTLFRGRMGTIVTLLGAALLIALLVVLFR